MKSVPKLANDYILNESEYQTCKACLAEANEKTVRHPLENPELEAQRQAHHEVHQWVRANLAPLVGTVTEANSSHCNGSSPILQNYYQSQEAIGFP